ncbi:hypothetical protein D3C87_1788540 [compost metagenome]
MLVHLVEDGEGVCEMRRIAQRLAQQVAMAALPVVRGCLEFRNLLEAALAGQRYRHPAATVGEFDLDAIGEAALGKLGVVKMDIDVGQ